MQRAYLQLLNRIKGAGFAPKGHVLDNEISDSMKSLIKSTCQLELVPPHCQRRNVAEVSIKAFKQHFLVILASVATDFPKSQWKRLLPQAELTLNLLRQENTTPKVFALAYIWDIRLQSNATWSNGMRSTHPREIWGTCIMGQPRSIQMVYIHLPCPLPCPCLSNQ